MASSPSTSSGEKSATAQITTRASYLAGFDLNPPASGAATLKIYDSSAAGTSKLIASATCNAGQNSVNIEWTDERIANDGIYAVLTGTTTYAVTFLLG